jgi:hypothetical protein
MNQLMRAKDWPITSGSGKSLWGKTRQILQQVNKVNFIKNVILTGDAGQLAAVVNSCK